MHYVGQTMRTLGQCMVGHFAAIRAENKKFPVGLHFSRKNRHNGLDDVKLYVLEFCQTPATRTI